MTGAPRASRVRCGVPQATVSAVAPLQVLTHTAATTRDTHRRGGYRDAEAGGLTNAVVHARVAAAHIDGIPVHG